MITTEIIDGIMQLVHTIKYSNGSTVKRILNKKTRLPERIIRVK